MSGFGRPSLLTLSGCESIALFQWLVANHSQQEQSVYLCSLSFSLICPICHLKQIVFVDRAKLEHILKLRSLRMWVKEWEWTVYLISLLLLIVFFPSLLSPYLLVFFRHLLVEVESLVCVGTLSAMASANVTLENQLHSAQKNLLFLQQDHANTLKGLHAEIRRLQQQCTGEHGHDYQQFFSSYHWRKPAHSRTLQEVSEDSRANNKCQ